MNKELLKDIEFSSYQLDQDNVPDNIYYILFDELFLLAQREFISDDITKEQFSDEYGNYTKIYSLYYSILEFFLKNHNEVDLVKTIDDYHYKLVLVK